ncbi:MAG: substrate-binding domain-containing protein [Anaerolineae bacterium]|nr:substrate-binding domain-containing protein [Anaerolineae bacterium]
MTGGQPQKKRPTIGLLTRKLTYTWALSQVQGMVDACRERDVNLICFPGGIIFHPDGFEAQDDIVYDLASDGKLDGLIVSTSTITGSLPDDEDVKDFYKRFQPRPIVGLERSLPGIPTVLKSEYEPMCEAMAHLIEVHGYRRIAYINRLGAGPHRERYQAYKDTLAKYNIPYNPDLVFSAYLDLPDLTGGGLQSGIDFEAVATSDDDFALGVLRALQAHGVRVPEQVAVTGFDDVAESWTVTPPLTTVSPPFHEMGYRAVEMLLALLAGEAVPDQVILPCKLTVRQSCGCMPIQAARAEIQLPVEMKFDRTVQTEAGQKSLNAVLVAHRADIVAEMAQAVGPEESNTGAGTSP